MKFTVVHRENMYKGKAFEVHKLQVRLPDDRLTYYDLVSHPGAVTIIPIDDDGNILFVRQFRIGIEADLLELPAGTLDDEEHPDVCAAREIREETGMAARSIKKLGEFFLAPGYSSEHMYVYLCTGLYPDALEADDDEYLQVEKIPVQRAYELAKNGEIHDGKTLACLFMAEPYILMP